MNIKSLKKTINSTFKEIFLPIDYGDFERKPLSYVQTHTEQKNFIGYLPEKISLQSFDEYQEFSKLSQELLMSLFSSIGVEYVPEITIYQLEFKTPIEVFENFCHTFGKRRVSNKEESELIYAEQLNQVIFKLKYMDEFREEYTFNSQPIYKALAKGDFNETDKLIKLLKEAYSILENKTLFIEHEVKNNLIKNWHQIKVLNKIKKDIERV